jgi:aminoglycoside phosphotransferase (APT) family kinase protein
MIAGAPDAGSATVPGWVIARLGEGLSSVAKLPWGFTNETWAATTPEGERYAVTRMASPAAASFVVRTGPEIARRVAAVGLDMPAPIAERSDPSEGVVVSRWLDGRPAMSRLDGPRGAVVVGQAVGDAMRRLAAVDIAGLPLDETWARPGDLAIAAEGWLRRLQPTLGRSMTATIAPLIEKVAPRRAARASFVHGDLVPANLLLRDQGNVLLDLEAARIGDAMLDAAWFRWIVAYHHPRLEAEAWSSFAAAAQPARDDPGSGELLTIYPVLRILEILASTAPGAASPDRWIAQLASALSRAAKP